ncbi:hypothetical protein HPB51_000070 [Rhipicephalus microplus]|uniref:26S proteasome regulatory subunit RPN11 C-terminal domain-containing protein n=1 Tax=Rhipicephalus microplus TaxID=6941 RepID=A0A9J6DRN2_RHIMP|nr:hypothetical protein HPB51_000070 [Rhipicephalus microplus]
MIRHSAGDDIGVIWSTRAHVRRNVCDARPLALASIVRLVLVTKHDLNALIHGLNRHYYSISINYRKNELEQKMLLNLHKKSWTDGLTLQDYDEHCKVNESTVAEMLELAKAYNKTQ